MDGAIKWIETIYEAMPLPFLEIWGRFGYLIGLVLMVCAFGGFTFRPGGRWGVGRERQSWDAKALWSIFLTLVLVLSTGYVGSFIVLVPGAQTFESLKDLAVFACIVLFGYPALIIVPFAYILSDLIEGVPFSFILDWLPGYFIISACHWMAYQLIGKNPDFRQSRTWGRYLLFVLAFMSIYPQLWGYVCAGKFTPEISHRNITPAVFFTMAITWIIAPFAMLAALPLARKFGFYWAAIPGYVKQRLLDQNGWVWESGGGSGGTREDGEPSGLPIRLFLATPFIALVLIMVGTTAYVTLDSAEKSANKLATRLHQDSSENINLYLDDYLERSQHLDQYWRINHINYFLRQLPIALQGRAFIVDRSGGLIASSGNSVRSSSFPNSDDPVVEKAVKALHETIGNLDTLRPPVQVKFDIVTAKPLSTETWLVQATPYQDRSETTDWVLMTAIPATYYLEGVRTGSSHSAMVFAIALALSLAVAAGLATAVTAPIRRISLATRELMKGNLTQRVPESRLEELGILSRSFNKMAGQLQQSFDDLRSQVEMRKERERELEESQARVRQSEERLQLATQAAQLGIWDWDVKKDVLIFDDAMYRHYGIVDKEAFGGTYEAWSKHLVPEDLERVAADIEAALQRDGNYALEFRIRWPDGSIRHIKGMGRTIRGKDGQPVRVVGVNADITARKLIEQELITSREQLRKMAAYETNAREAERKRLARELHDELGQLLTGIKMDLFLLNNELPAAEKLPSRMESLNQLIDQILASVRRISADLRPAMLDELGLKAALEWMAEAFEKRYRSISCLLTFEIGDYHPVADVSTATYRIIQECLTNVARHSGATTVEICISLSDENRLAISVQDNGVGMPEQKKEGGFGLLGIRERVNALGGQFTMISLPGQGVSVRIAIPIVRTDAVEEVA